MGRVIKESVVVAAGQFGKQIVDLNFLDIKARCVEVGDLAKRARLIKQIEASVPSRKIRIQLIAIEPMRLPQRLPIRTGRRAEISVQDRQQQSVQCSGNER